MGINIFVNRERSGWIFDEIHADYRKFSRHSVVPFSESPQVCWFLNPWAFPNVATRLTCPSFVQVHHVDETKISQWHPVFDVINRFATGVIVPCKNTENFIDKYINVPVHRSPYWLLSKMSSPEFNRHVKKEQGEVLIGSFQKDSEGNSNSPKMSKGPDVLVNVLLKIREKRKIKVILSGYNRGYLTEKLENLEIPFVYLKRFNDIPSLYDSIDWYFITSRTEGGPQSALEASYRRVKILSTDAGISPEVLHSDCICKDVNEFASKFEDDLDRRDYNFNNVSENFMPSVVVSRLDDFFEGSAGK